MSSIALRIYLPGVKAPESVVAGWKRFPGGKAPGPFKRCSHLKQTTSGTARLNRLTGLLLEGEVSPLHLLWGRWFER